MTWRHTPRYALRLAVKSEPQEFFLRKNSCFLKFVLEYYVVLAENNSPRPRHNRVLNPPEPRFRRKRNFKKQVGAAQRFARSRDGLANEAYALCPSGKTLSYAEWF